MDSRRIGIITLAVLTLLAPLGCRRFNRRCDPPRQESLPDATDPGVIPPRGSTIPDPGLPVRPEAGRRDTYSPARPGPRLSDPVEPYSFRSSDPGVVSPFELPRPIESESKKLFDPAPQKKVEASPGQPDPALPKKKMLIPDTMPDAPDSIKDDKAESKYEPKTEGTKPVPDRNVFLDPVAPGGPFDLPKTAPNVNEERDDTRRESKASPKPETPPVGLASFQTVAGKPNVASGQKPTMDGYEWLAKNGYKTLVFAHNPTADVAPVKAACEAAGLKFVAIPTGPETIPAATEAFNTAVAAKDGPVYVCDDTGLRAATLWYAHFRKVDLATPDTAKVRANGLGLGDTDTNVEQKKLWDAVQTHLSAK